LQELILEELFPPTTDEAFEFSMQLYSPDKMEDFEESLIKLHIPPRIEEF
jgi:hypothetical protein